MVHRRAFVAAAARYRNIYRCLQTVFEQYGKDYVSYNDMEDLQIAAQRQAEQNAEVGEIKPAWYDIMKALQAGIGDEKSSQVAQPKSELDFSLNSDGLLRRPRRGGSANRWLCESKQPKPRSSRARRDPCNPQTLPQTPCHVSRSGS